MIFWGPWLRAHLLVGKRFSEKVATEEKKLAKDASYAMHTTFDGSDSHPLTSLLFCPPIHWACVSNPFWIKMIIWAFEVVLVGIWTYGHIGLSAAFQIGREEKFHWSFENLWSFYWCCFWVNQTSFRQTNHLICLQNLPHIVNILSTWRKQMQNLIYLHHHPDDINHHQHLHHHLPH